MSLKKIGEHLDTTISGIEKLLDTDRIYNGGYDRSGTFTMFGDSIANSVLNTTIKKTEDYYQIDDIDCIFDTNKIGKSKNPKVTEEKKEVKWESVVTFPEGLGQYGHQINTWQPIARNQPFKSLTSNTVPVICLYERASYEIDGSIIFNKDDNKLQIYVGSIWINLN